MSDKERLKDIKNTIKYYYEMNDAQYFNWFRTPNPVFKGKTPQQLSKSKMGLKRLEYIVFKTEKELRVRKYSRPIGGLVRS